VRGLVRVLVVLVVLGGLLLVADRVGAYVAQRTVAEQVTTELASYQVESDPPDVSIGGFPFLTQVGAGQYEQVTLLLRDVGTGEVRLSEVELIATGVSAAASTLLAQEGPIDAERIDGTATIGYDTVAALAGRDGLTVAPIDGGALRIEVDDEVLGEPVTLVGTANLSVVDGTVQLRVSDVEFEEPSGVPPGAERLIDEVTNDMALDVPLPPLPYNLTVETVRVESAGLVVGVSATDVPLAR
jgi:hypothetical protein